MASIVALCLVVVGVSMDSGDAAGPWRGQIIDAETLRPVSGAIILMVWWKRFPGAMHEGREFYDAKEVVTDADGGFVVPAVDTRQRNPFHHVQGPKLQVFKPGYSPLWRFLGAPDSFTAPVEARDNWHADAWRRFEHDGVLITIDRVNGREARLRALEPPDFGVPIEKAPQFYRAYERAYDNEIHGRHPDKDR